MEDHGYEKSEEMDVEETPEELKRKELATELKYVQRVAISNSRGHIKFRNYHPRDEVFRGCMTSPTRNYLKDAERRFDQLNQGIDDDVRPVLLLLLTWKVFALSGTQETQLGFETGHR
jgi:hypothetical protein